VLNRPEQALPFEDVLRYSQGIEIELASLTTVCPKGSPSVEGLEDDAGLALLKLQLLQLLCALHVSVLQSSDSGTTAAAYSNTALLAACTSVIDIHRSLVAAQHHALLMMRDDVIRVLAAGTLLAAKLFDVEGTTQKRIYSQCLEIFQDGLPLIEAKVRRVGVTEPCAWLAFALYDFVRCKGVEEIASENPDSGFQRRLRLTQMLIAQQDPEFFERVARTSGIGGSKSADQTGDASQNMGHVSASMGNEWLAEAEIGDVANWALDDWMLDDFSLSFGGYSLP